MTNGFASELASLRENVALAPRTTLELGGAARYFVEAHDLPTLRAALSFAREHRLAVLPLGGGSNVVVADAGFDGLAIAIAMDDVEVLPARDGVRRAIVDAGVAWDRLVADAIALDLAGIECLSGIPGSVGATPIQNVGAYGQEVRETIVAVTTIDRDTLAERVRTADECGFGYRHSAFKEASACDARGPREIVTSVTFALHEHGRPAIRYAELGRALAGMATPSLAVVRDTVLALRRAKSMVLDPVNPSHPVDPNRRSAGSFFTNPIVSTVHADHVAARARARSNAHDMPRFPADRGLVKLAAGWLIEHAGFAKGMRSGHVGLSTNHALALVHHGGGTSRELLAFADTIIAGVRTAFDVTLALEPVCVGFSRSTSISR